MKTFLFGIKSIEFSKNLILHDDCTTAVDGRVLRYDNNKTEWTKIKLHKPGSINYAFKKENGVNICDVNMEFVSRTDIESSSRLDFKVEDMEGHCLLVGLGDGYMTDPVVSVSDNLGNNASDGVVQKYTVTWRNICGRIYTLPYL